MSVEDVHFHQLYEIPLFLDTAQRWMKFSLALCFNVLSNLQLLAPNHTFGHTTNSNLLNDHVVKVGAPSPTSVQDVGGLQTAPPVKGATSTTSSRHGDRGDVELGCWTHTKGDGLEGPRNEYSRQETQIWHWRLSPLCRVQCQDLQWGGIVPLPISCAPWCPWWSPPFWWVCPPCSKELAPEPETRDTRHPQSGVASPHRRVGSKGLYWGQTSTPSISRVLPLHGHILTRPEFLKFEVFWYMFPAKSCFALDKNIDHMRNTLWIAKDGWVPRGAEARCLDCPDI